jgi:EpsD family peptidyl-prolyl cis-trans isomerase
MKRMLNARVAASAIVIALALSACGREAAKPKEAVVEKKSSGPAAARVNAAEISVEQVNGMLSRAGTVPPEQARAAGRQILDRLIDQEILVQKAAEQKLDQDPKVIQAIETSRREILSRAYLEYAAAAAAKPGEQEIKDYYDKHPELFKERRVYNMREIAINAQQDILPALQAQMAKSKSLNDVVNWLKGKNIQFATNQGTKAAEQLPLEVLPKFHQLKDGQTAVLPMAGGLLVVQVVASQTQPLDEAQAKPFIEQFLSNQRRSEIAAAEMKKLRETAKVEYLGDFAKPVEEGKSVMEGAASTPAPPAAAPAAPAGADKGTAAK